MASSEDSARWDWWYFQPTHWSYHRGW